jgi:hypothetical protein
MQATVTEIRPDGKETFVQHGCVRATERKLDPNKSTLLEPVLSLRAADVSPLPSDRYVPVTIPLSYQGHALTGGLPQIRVTISAERRPADLVVRRDRPAGCGERLDRPFNAVAVPAAAARGAGRERPDRPAAVSRTAR